MYVKELTLRGFKSFANATTLRFEPGITAVVGPNGSGKSNIVDALAWVMGEQGAKTLRGTSMEDVIFAGTSSRPPLGRAQVSLTIDNSDRTLDIDYSEVTISRTIYRNGGSEYAINGSPARLLDVQELLSDIGLGAHMHVVVGQGRLDSILRATPADNRAFIEEAAGILKHRKRKERALRKLQSTQENVERLDDLLTEIKRQLGPLRRQARVSRKADSIQISLRDAMSRLYADDAVQVMASRDQVRSDLAQIRGDLAREQQELTRVKLQIERLEDLASQSSPAMEAINQTWHQMSQLEERFKSLAALASERSRSWTSQIVSIGGDDPDILLKRAGELAALARSEEGRNQDQRLAFDKETESRAAAEKELASIRQMITQLRKDAQERDAHIASVREMIARQEARKQGLDGRESDLASQKASLATLRQETQARLDSLHAQEQAPEEVDEDRLEALRSAMDEARGRRDEARNKQRDLQSTVISLKAKADALGDTLEARTTSTDMEKQEGVDVRGRLASFIRVEEGWEEAISKALGPFASALVLPDSTHLLPAMALARQEKLGRAVALVPRIRLSDSFKLSDSSDLADRLGLIWAGKVVTPNPLAEDADLACQIAQSVRFLLSDVFLAADLDQVQEVLTRADWGLDDCPFGQIAVRTGEVITPVGALGGSSQSPSDLSLAARRDKALAQAGKAQDEADSCQESIDSNDKAYTDLRAQVEETKTKLTELRLRRQQADRDLAATQQSLESLDRRQADLDRKLASLADERQGLDSTLTTLQEDLRSAQTVEKADLNPDDLARQEHDREARLASQREKEVAAKISWNESSQKLQSYKRQADLLRSQAQQAQSRRARIEEENQERRAKAVQAVQVASLATQAAQTLMVHMDQVSAKRQELQAQASSHDEELTVLRARRRDLEPRVNALIQREHDSDVLRERVAAQVGQVTQKVMDDLGLNLDELLHSYSPDLPVPLLDDYGRPIPLDQAVNGEGDDREETDDSQGRFRTEPYDRQKQEKRLAQARRDLAALGKVNPLATEEYDALQTRHQYLSEQRNEVVTSRDNLMKLIRDLDSTMVTVFKEAFDDTAAAFEKVFGTLFQGGHGRLRLEDPDDLLNTGVIVEASPAGKRVRQLTLLSGGERSLTALALLFAIFTARPSPFYILDEVEAALDDINLTRLLKAFNNLRQRSQLIIITHQQRTMSIADALYGVTMRSDGVTAVISQKLQQGKVDLEG
ncbi:chromosome segregation protein SMC [Parascardovia denticolens DSM 10105 = JCM 12538]|uniref:Chromosome partition protein Smc n=1 Tax=Parascardovia denticolens DSM 10105 = JCM 12538 TaxID=864564 RepID=E6JZA5_PARDN|nr:chromosome segregation protein SMC [Parascardovia denticolens]EFG33546.1 chromosome segregation protein SMC [Parascardovia denticolens F0305]EFT83995.1 chromosome segregation protein SMC [Parascardovia denticolens DSM 10105 = JCM 12538]BAR05163.1 chromosome segregation protein SMC [Parascardovia denticolens DSM 10105 = JCM 12538]